jgi:hypothetical protein
LPNLNSRIDLCVLCANLGFFSAVNGFQVSLNRRGEPRLAQRNTEEEFKESPTSP